MNWHAWWQWGIDHQSRFLFLFFLTCSIVYTLVALLAGYEVSRLRPENRLAIAFTRQIALLLLAVGFLGVTEFAANIDPPLCRCPQPGMRYPAWFALWYWAGRLFLSVRVVLFWRFTKMLLKNGGLEDSDGRKER